ncbi:MAG: hypothetical protein ABEL76_02825 [Bradymonadaceae bacterium]
MKGAFECDASDLDGSDYRQRLWQVSDGATTGDAERKTGDERPFPTGEVTVDAEPEGDIVVDGVWTEEQTPGTVELSAGEHRICVEFGTDGALSSPRTVRVREDTRRKVFIRKEK